MRKLIVMASVSLDGFFEGPNRELDWQLIDEEIHQHFNDELKTMSAFLDGRVSHELMVSYWPTADQNPESSPQEKEFSGIWREMTKFVYSRTLQSAEWNTTVVHEVVPDEIRALKERPGGDMGLGGANLAASFLRHGLIDEYWLYIHPVVLGKGRPLFQTPELTVPLHLLETRTFGSGVVMVKYRVGEAFPTS